MRYDVFISCKSEDYNIGRQVYEFLTNYRGLNLHVFMADRELRKRECGTQTTVKLSMKLLTPLLILSLCPQMPTI